MQVNTNTQEPVKQDANPVGKPVEQLRTVNDIIDFYTNRKA